MGILNGDVVQLFACMFNTYVSIMLGKHQLLPAEQDNTIVCYHCHSHNVIIKS